MSTDIFQLDWIFIDTIIIILLILLLLGVKVYKLTHRWRFSFSNEALEYTIYRKPPLKINDQSISSSNWTLTRNIFLIRFFKSRAPFPRLHRDVPGCESGLSLLHS